MSRRQRQQRVRAILPQRGRRTRIQPGAPPGTLVAGASAEMPTIDVTTFDRTKAETQKVATLDEALARLGQSAVTWINIDGLGDPTLVARLGERLGLHPLALEDVLNVPQRPKVERFEKHVFVVMRTIRLERPAGSDGPGSIKDEQISMFFGTDWVVTIQERADGDSFGPLRESIRQGRGRVREMGADYLAYLLVDAVVDAYFPVLDELGDRLHALEAEALTSSSDDTLVRLQWLRHDLVFVRRAVWPMREEAAALLRDESSLVTAETRIFLRDVYDHAVQALELVETLREMSVSVMEVYLSAQNQRLNAVMKVLTVISTIFIPLTFIASIYGMNFKYMPELSSPWGYPAVLGVMAVTAAAMVGYFKHRGVVVMRVLVVGAGGVGGFFGARLARAGVAVTFLARGPHLDAIQRDGLRVRSVTDGEWTVKVDATGDPRGRAPADVVLFCVKSFDTETAAAAIRPAIGPETAVVSLQNGVDNEDALARVLGPGHAVGGVAWVFAAIEAPGVIVHRLGGRLAFGELDRRSSPRLERLRAAFTSAGVAAEVPTDITRVLWEKYLLICAQAGMTALTRAPIGVIRSVPESWRMYRRLVEELAALAQASGVHLAPDVVDSIVRDASALAPAVYSSLHHDLTQGRRLELEALHGHAVRLGERLGVPTPMLFAVYAALRPHADGAAGRGAPE